MVISAYKFSLPTGKGNRVNFIDTVIVMAASQADALAMVQSAYPNLPAGYWAGAADTVTNPGVAADYAGFQFNWVASTKSGFYLGVTSDTENTVATGVAASMVAAGVAGSPAASTNAVTLTTPGFSNTACSATTNYVGNLAAVDANIDPYSRQNLQNISGCAMVISGTTSPVFTVPVRANFAPNILGWFQDRSILE